MRLSFGGSQSEIYSQVVSKCKILGGRYLPTPWLSSPHLQTAFLNFFGRPPRFSYTRQLFNTPDGGTIAFDWLRPSDVIRGPVHTSNVISQDDTTPIVLVIPGLMSDSSAAYIKHLALNIATTGWNVVICNHRGLGGVSLTSEWFYNAGWTEDLRTVVNYFHGEYPKAPLFAVGTSIGANVMVKYLGEDGDSTHIAGAAAICSPWDLLICDRFINRGLVQSVYNRAITAGLQLYAHKHQSIYSRLADWEGIRKSRSVRDFDNHATCILGKYETVDMYYRHSSSAGYIKNVTVPLLCISALDDPVCTREAIPWDECRANKNIILATTSHGGHLAFFEGITANSLWWVRAVDEFFSILSSTQLMHKRKETQVGSPVEPQIDQGPYVNFTDDGMVDEGTGSSNTVANLPEETENVEPDLEQDNLNTETKSCEEGNEAAGPVKKCLKELSRHTRLSIWLLAYIAIITSWPLLGLVFKRKVRNVLPAAWFRK